jgi:RNA polymerase sigma-70 factor, ECF subfamily
MNVAPASRSPQAQPDEAPDSSGFLTRERQRALYESHFSFVWRSLRRLGVPEVVAEDAAQDVFLVVHRRHDSYDARWSRVETWLFGIVLRVARDYLRSQRRWRSRFDSSADVEQALERRRAPTGDPDAELARSEAVALLERALDALADTKRAVLVMVDIEGFTVPEAAEALGVNVNTAYWRLRVGRADFERALTHARLCRKQRGVPS